MIANYHAHTSLCNHASGELFEYVDNALERGLHIFGFSDHAPQWYPENFRSRIRMLPEELTGYCRDVRQLQEKYAGKMQIPLGLEAEFYPALFPRLLEEAKDAGVEYFLLAQHWIGNELNEPYVGHPHNDEKLLERYCRQIADALQTGLFTYVAHPDLVNYKGDPKIFDRHMRWLCREANAANTPLELNFLGMIMDKHYPREAFWRIAGEEGCTVVFGMDAHDPEQVLDEQVERSARRMATRCGLKVVDTVPLRKL